MNKASLKNNAAVNCHVAINKLLSENHFTTQHYIRACFFFPLNAKLSFVVSSCSKCTLGKPKWVWPMCVMFRITDCHLVLYVILTRSLCLFFCFLGGLLSENAKSPRKNGERNNDTAKSCKSRLCLQSFLRRVQLKQSCFWVCLLASSSLAAV